MSVSRMSQNSCLLTAFCQLLLHQISWTSDKRRVKREKPTRCNQSDVCYQTSISTCFRHHYAHHQENKTVYCSIWCSALVVLAVVVWSCILSCVHCVKVTVQNSNLHTVHTAHDADPHNYSQPQPAQPVQNTICGSTRSCSPDDGHNDARNMLR